MNQKKPSFLLLFLLISFGSVAAVLFTPALPQISQFFEVTENKVQLTITLFLVGYAVGQLIYGPLANGYGRKIALIFGIALEIIASIFCLLAAKLHLFWLLVAARLLMALGASVGLKMTFTLVADCYEPTEGNKLISHLMMAFAITPGLGVALGGWLTQHYDWPSCFLALAVYGIFLLLLALPMRETALNLDKEALKPRSIINKYKKAFMNIPLLCGGILMGSGTAFVYVFASLAPFIAMNLMHLQPATYGSWNLLPPVGIILGSQLAARASKLLSPLKAIYLGLTIAIIGIAIMFIAFLYGQALAKFLFFPLVIIYVGISFIFGNASSVAMQSTEDKSTASAVMNFINMGIATICVLLLGFVSSTNLLLLPSAFVLLGALGIFSALLLMKHGASALTQ